MKIINLIIFIMLFSFTFGQTNEERKKIVSTYDVDLSNEVTQELTAENFKKQQRVQEFYNSLTETEKELVDIDNLYDIGDDGAPLYRYNDNDGSSKTIRANRLYTGGSLGLNVNGENMIAGVWEAEGGYPRESHLDLSPRADVIDGSPNINNINFHATHVTGTIISSGENISLQLGRGIAYMASARCFNSQNDTGEMAQEAGQGLLVSNHSYGLGASNLPVWRFGAYEGDARTIDILTNTFRYYLPVISAGNDRDSFSLYNPTKGGYDLLTGQSVSKNGITSAAVVQVPNYVGPNSVIMSNFSNWGPTDDGRIKPDISSKGVGVLSTTNASDTSYGNSSGTSMSAPAITGLLLLLQQHFNNNNDRYMLAATARGLLLHTADEAGIHQGPDYNFGWGLANGEQAANTITFNGESSYMDEASIDNGEINRIDIRALGNQPLKISICWTDPAGVSVSNEEDSRTPVIVNDLDVKVSKDGTDYYPWKLDPVLDNAPASRDSTNDVDNFERVDIDTTEENDIYQVAISHKGTLDGGSQNYSLIVTGGVLANTSTEDVSNIGNDIEIYPNPVRTQFSLRNSNNANPWNFVEVLDATSKLVHTQKLEGNINQEDVPVKQLTPGVYYLRIYTEKGIVNKKIIKK